MPRGHCHRHGGERPCTCAMGNLYRFVEPVVLYALENNGPTYGYELGGTLQDHALTDAEIDRGALYRTLQRLETVGYVTSDWDTSGSGPARHVYSITESGKEHLREWAVVLRKLAQSMRSFVTMSNYLVTASKAMPILPKHRLFLEISITGTTIVRMGSSVIPAQSVLPALDSITVVTHPEVLFGECGTVVRSALL